MTVLYFLSKSMITNELKSKRFYSTPTHEDGSLS